RRPRRGAHWRGTGAGLGRLDAIRSSSPARASGNRRGARGARVGAGDGGLATGKANPASLAAPGGPRAARDRHAHRRAGDWWLSLPAGLARVVRPRNRPERLPRARRRDRWLPRADLRKVVPVRWTFGLPALALVGMAW